MARLGRGDPVDVRAQAEVPPGEGRVQHESGGRLKADESPGDLSAASHCSRTRNILFEFPFVVAWVFDVLLLGLNQTNGQRGRCGAGRAGEIAFYS